MRLLAVLILATLQFCCQHSAHGSVSISLKSEVCPLEPVTVLCEINSTSTKFGLEWSCDGPGETRAGRQVTCTSGSSILDLQCSQGAGSLTMPECEMGRIVSAITFGPNNTGSSITCGDALNMTVRQSLSIEVEVPSSPELNYIRVENSTNNNSNTVVFEFLLIPKNGTMYWISVEPASPECVESCLYSTENTTISIPLQGNVLYNITSKASRCNREVNSTESKLTDFVLQVPDKVECNVTYENDEDILQADIQWNDVTVEPRNVNAVTSNVTTYEFMFHSGNKIIQNITLQRNDSFCSSISGMCDHKQSVNISDSSNITLFVTARNRFGIGPEKRCFTMENAEPKPPNGKSNSAMDVAIGIGIGIGTATPVLIMVGVTVLLLIIIYKKTVQRPESKPTTPDTTFQLSPLNDYTIETNERRNSSNDPKENFQIQVIQIPEDHNNKQLQPDTTSSSNLPTTTIENKNTFCSEEIRGISLTKDMLVCSDVEGEMGTVRVFDRTRNIPQQKFKISGLSRPRGVIVFKDHIYVVESSRNRILKFDMEGKFVCKSPGLLKFTLPRGIAAMDDWIFVCNTGENEIKILDDNLIFRFTVSNKKKLAICSPNDVACLRGNDSEGYRLYVANNIANIGVFEVFLTDQPRARSITIINPSDMGVTLGCDSLRSICIINERYLYVTEMCSNGRILCLDLNDEGFCIKTIKRKHSVNLSYPTVIAHYEDIIAYSELDQLKSEHTGCYIYFFKSPA